MDRDELEGVDRDFLLLVALSGPWRAKISARTFPSSEAASTCTGAPAASLIVRGASGTPIRWDTRPRMTSSARRCTAESLTWPSASAAANSAASWSGLAAGEAKGAARREVGKDGMPGVALLAQPLRQAVVGGLHLGGEAADGDH